MMLDRSECSFPPLLFFYIAYSRRLSLQMAKICRFDPQERQSTTAMFKIIVSFNNDNFPGNIFTIKTNLSIYLYIPLYV